MKKKSFFFEREKVLTALYIIFVLLSNAKVFGQPFQAKGFFGIRTGYLNSMTKTANSQANISFRGVDNKNGFYLGGYYENSMSKFLAYRLELNYQSKGLITTTGSGIESSRNRYSYVGITPLLSIKPTNSIGLYVGPEVNVLVDKKSVFHNNTPIEIGLAGRVNYFYRSIGFEAGYFVGFNKYETLEIDPTVSAEFKNYNWQLGLVYKF